MKSAFASLVLIAAVLAATAVPTDVRADQQVRCESEKNRYHHCRIDTHGFVRLTRQLSHAECIQGRTWDYDRSGIWVDDGCRAEFIVEERTHSGSHGDHDAGKVVAAAAGLAIIGALVAASNDKDDKHHDDDYHGSRHTSYVPKWMVGNWDGFNMRYNAEVEMSISRDGRVTAYADGHKIVGYVNDERLYIGDAEFYIERAGNGFNTVEAGNTSNRVHYSRR
jgi:hypothetical protein